MTPRQPVRNALNTVHGHQMSCLGQDNLSTFRSGASCQCIILGHTNVCLRSFFNHSRMDIHVLLNTITSTTNMLDSGICEPRWEIWGIWNWYFSLMWNQFSLPEYSSWVTELGPPFLPSGSWGLGSSHWLKHLQANVKVEGRWTIVHVRLQTYKVVFKQEALMLCWHDGLS